MAPGYLKTSTICILYPNAYLARKKDWSKDRLQSWITQAGGKFETKLSPNTTHFIISDEAWKDKYPEVRLAEAAQGDTNPKLKIVHAEWLEQALLSKKMVSTAQYIREEPKLTPKQRSAKKITKEGDQTVKPGKSLPNLIQQTFEEATAPFMSEEDKRDVDQKRENLRKQKLAIEEEERKAEAEAAAEARALDEKKKQTKTTAVFQQTHHIYEDENAFKYDVLLVRSGITSNTSQCHNLTIQIWESDDSIPEYAVNVVFHATHQNSTQNRLIAEGAPYFTAMRHFLSFFKGRTGVDWDKRLDPPEAIGRHEANGHLQETHKKQFRYQTPPPVMPSGSIAVSLENQGLGSGRRDGPSIPGERGITIDGGAEVVGESIKRDITDKVIDENNSNDFDSSHAGFGPGRTVLSKRKIASVSSDDEAAPSAKKPRGDEE